MTTPVAPAGSAGLWFSPRLLGLHLLAVVVLAVCVAAGLWQLGVYDSHQHDESSSRQHVATVPLGSVWSADAAFGDDLSYRPVSLTGTFAPADDQVWVTGRTQGTRTGYWLLSPVLVGGDEHALLVVRGWSPTRTTLPAVPSGTVSLRVILQPGEGSTTPFDPATRSLDSVNVPALLNVVPYDLYSGYGVSTTASASGGLALASAPTPDAPWTAGLRNLAYALQWWVFGLFALFMWFRMCREWVDLQMAERDALWAEGSLTP